MFPPKCLILNGNWHFWVPSGMGGGRERTDPHHGRAKIRRAYRPTSRKGKNQPVPGEGAQPRIVERPTSPGGPEKFFEKLG